MADGADNPRRLGLPRRGRQPPADDPVIPPRARIVWPKAPARPATLTQDEWTTFRATLFAAIAHVDGPSETAARARTDLATVVRRLDAAKGRNDHGDLADFQMFLVLRAAAHDGKVAAAQVRAMLEAYRATGDGWHPHIASLRQSLRTERHAFARFQKLTSLSYRVPEKDQPLLLAWYLRTEDSRERGVRKKDVLTLIRSFLSAKKDAELRNIAGQLKHDLDKARAAANVPPFPAGTNVQVLGGHVRIARGDDDDDEETQEEESSSDDGRESDDLRGEGNPADDDAVQALVDMAERPPPPRPRRMDLDQEGEEGEEGEEEEARRAMLEPGPAAPTGYDKEHPGRYVPASKRNKPDNPAARSWMQEMQAIGARLGQASGWDNPAIRSCQRAQRAAGCRTVAATWSSALPSHGPSGWRPGP